MLKISRSKEQAKSQWLQDSSETNGDNLKIVRREVSIYFRNKKKEYLKYEINELAINSKSKNIRYLYRKINEFMRGYQPRNNLVKYEYVDRLADSNIFLSRWKNCFSQLLNVHNASDTTEPLVPSPSRLEVETAIAKLK
jgi:hypothetical protein